MSEERALIARAVTGDRPALDRLAALHRPTVLRIARHVLGDREAAEDATQDVFVRLHLWLPRFRGESELSTWLYRVTLNVCRDQLRRRRRAAGGQAREDAGPWVHDDPGFDLDARRLREAVRAAVNGLPDDQKEAITLRYLSGLSYAEIAERTATPQGTVASRVFRGLKRLGRDLAPRRLELIK